MEKGGFLRLMVRIIVAEICNSRNGIVCEASEESVQPRMTVAAAPAAASNVVRHSAHPIAVPALDTNSPVSSQWCHQVREVAPQRLPDPDQSSRSAKG